MPHSEYPSGSACLCEAIQEFADAYFVRTGGQSIGLAATVAAGSSNAGRHGVRPKLTRRSAREQARAFHSHFHTTMFICLLSGICTIIPSSLPRAGPFSSYKSPCCVLV